MKSLAVLLPLALAVNACSLVVSEREVGNRPVNAAKFGGTWQATDEEKGILALTVRNAKDGIVTAKDGESDLEFELREKHGWVFANRVVAEEAASGFAWYRVEMAPDGQSFRLWTPDASAFEQLIVAGTLKGRVMERGQPAPQPGAPANPAAQNAGGSGTVVVISEKDDRWIQKMMEGRYGPVFETDGPATYIRVAEEREVEGGGE